VGGEVSVASASGRDPDELQDSEEPSTADVEGLRRFLEGQVLPWFDNRKKELANRPLIREQAFGEALDPDKLDRLVTYAIEPRFFRPRREKRRYKPGTHPDYHTIKVVMTDGTEPPAPPGARRATRCISISTRNPILSHTAALEQR
jgi:hypothetical protein